MIRVVWLSILLLCTAFAAPMRPLALQGDFYPADPFQLDQLVRDFLNKARAPHGYKPRLLITPHDRLWRSGFTAAIAYQRLKGHHYDQIILIGPYHKDMFQGIAVWTDGDWQSPTGSIQIDEVLAHKIAKTLGTLQQSPQLHMLEHSLETQLPFLVQVQPKTRIVPILISDNQYYKALAKAIIHHIQGLNVLIIISTDLSHEHSLAETQTIDQKTLELIRKGRPEALKQAINDLEIELCGSAAILAGLEVARALKWGHAQILHWDTNAPIINDETSVVGYAAVVINS